MLHIFLFVIILGLAAIDPIGIAVMPVLLVQKRPLLRSAAFLGGSFISLMTMGLVCALGLGQRVLALERAWPWLQLSAEGLLAVVLIGIAGVLIYRRSYIHGDVKLPAVLSRSIQAGVWRLSVAGALLVALQSLADVVFLVAMIRLGQLHFAIPLLTAAVATYATAALALQILVVGAYVWTPTTQREAVTHAVRTWLVRYAPHVTIVVSLILGALLGAQVLATVAGHRL